MQQTTNSIEPALRDFDQMAASAHVRIRTVASLYGCSISSVWRGVKEGRIPAPRKLSPRTTCWNVGELRKALAQSA